MQEDLEKNLVLLSKIAKEKKYAQEYLGLLARRGDIGSIRIGKRWYTTWQWFEEFWEISQKKKEAAGEMKIAEPAGVEAEKNPSVSSEKKEIKIGIPFVFPEKEKVFVSCPAENAQREERISGQLASSADKPAKIAVTVKTRNEENIPVRSTAIRMAGDVRITNKFNPPASLCKASFAREAFRAGNISVAERNKHAVPYPEIKFRKKADVFSPDLFREEKAGASLFSRFAFAFSFAMILLLVAASGYFVWSGGLLERGQVAGASDERNGGFPGIKSGSEYVLVSAGDKIKQSLSISKLIVQAAKEKSMNSEQN